MNDEIRPRKIENHPCVDCGNPHAPFGFKGEFKCAKCADMKAYKFGWDMQKTREDA